ncbi:MAG: AraC family transcriptional regulator [Acidobacteriota bacterium]
MSKTSHRAEQRIWRDTTVCGVSLLHARYFDQRFVPHADEHYVIAAMTGGRALCFGADGPVSEPGSLIVIPPGTVHDGCRLGNRPWSYVAAYPSSRRLQDLLRPWTGRDRPVPRFDRLVYRDAELATRFQQAHRLSLGGDDSLAAEEAMEGVLAALLERYSGLGGRVPPAGRQRRAMARVRDYMEAHLGRSLALDELAGVSGFSRFHFLRLFRAEVGLPPHAYLLQRRIVRARRLLRQGMAIAQVALACGFSDQAHLTRRFKQRVGVTPGEFVRGSRRRIVVP